ncbi:MAG: hypothetical protein WC782_02600 [Methylococcaceae bacterium]|jgi:hypothetical protein
MTDPNLQNQSQSQSLVLNIQNSSDLALEQKIFSQIASAGHQLGVISDVLDILVTAYRQNSKTTLTLDIESTLNRFKEMQVQIDQEKKARAPERVIEVLEAMRSEDQEAYLRMATSLRSWLNKQADL